MIAGRSRARAEFVKDVLAIVALAALAVGIPALIAIGSGALTIPHNDDFDYRRVALRLFRTGEIQLSGFSGMTLIGQLYFVQPFLWISAGADWSYAAATALLTVSGVAAAFALARRFLDRGVAVIAVVSLIAFPGFLVNTTSFMTDVPALAGALVCLALGAVALDSRGTRRWGWLVSSLVVGCFAFSIREFAVAAPVSVLVSVTAGETGKRAPYLLAGVVTAVVCAAIYSIAHGLPGQHSLPIDVSSLDVVRLRYVGATFGLVMAPALALAMTRWWRSWLFRDWMAGVLAGILVYQTELQEVISSRVPSLLIGNLLEPLGAPGGVSVGNRPLLLDSPLWEALNAIGLTAVILGFGVLGAGLGRWLRGGFVTHPDRFAAWLGSIQGLLVTFVVLCGAVIMTFGLVAPVFDRYLWPLSVPLACLLLRSAIGETDSTAPITVRRTGVIVAGLLTILLAGTSLAILLNSFAFDVAGWRMGEVAVSHGFRPETIDAGFAWVGYHSSGIANWGAAPSPSETWYGAIWPSFRSCAMVTSSLVDLPGFKLEYADIDAYRLLLVGGPEQGLYLYRVATPGCP